MQQAARLVNKNTFHHTAAQNDWCMTKQVWWIELVIFTKLFGINNNSEFIFTLPDGGQLILLLLLLLTKYQQLIQPLSQFYLQFVIPLYQSSTGRDTKKRLQLHKGNFLHTSIDRQIQTHFFNKGRRCYKLEKDWTSKMETRVILH